MGRISSESIIAQYIKDNWLFIKDQNLTLLRLANKIKKDCQLTVTSKTIMEHLKHIFQKEYNIDLNQQELHQQNITIYILTSIGYSTKDNEINYFTKIGATTNWQQERLGYKDKNPGCHVLAFEDFYDINLKLINLQADLNILYKQFTGGITKFPTEWLIIQPSMYNFIEEYSKGIVQNLKEDVCRGYSLECLSELYNKFCRGENIENKLARTLHPGIMGVSLDKTIIVKLSKEQTQLWSDIYDEIEQNDKIKIKMDKALDKKDLKLATYITDCILVETAKQFLKKENLLPIFVSDMQEEFNEEVAKNYNNLIEDMKKLPDNWIDI